MEKNKTMQSPKPFEMKNAINDDGLINDPKAISQLIDVRQIEESSEMDSLDQKYRNQQRIERVRVLDAVHAEEQGKTKIDGEDLQNIVKLTEELAKQAINNNKQANNNGGDDNPPPKVEIKKEEEKKTIDNQGNAFQDYENQILEDQGKTAIDSKGEDEKSKKVKENDRPKDLSKEARENIKTNRDILANDIIQALTSGKNLTRDQKASMRNAGMMNIILRRLPERFIYNFLINLFNTSRSKKDALKLLHRVIKINNKKQISLSFGGAFRLAAFSNRLTANAIKMIAGGKKLSPLQTTLGNRLVSNEMLTREQLEEVKQTSVPKMLFMTSSLTDTGIKVVNAISSSDKMDFDKISEKYPNFMQALIRSCDTQSQDFQKIKAAAQRDGKIVSDIAIAEVLRRRYEEEALDLHSGDTKSIMEQCADDRIVVKSEPPQNDKTIDFDGLKYVVDAKKEKNAVFYEIDGQEFTADQIELLAIRMAEEGQIPESVALAHIKAGGRNPYEIIAELKEIIDHVHKSLGFVVEKPIDQKHFLDDKSPLKEDEQDIQAVAEYDKTDAVEVQDLEQGGMENLNVLSTKVVPPKDQSIIDDDDFSDIMNNFFADQVDETQEKPKHNLGHNRVDLGESDNVSSDFYSEDKQNQNSIADDLEEVVGQDIEEDIIEEIVEEDIIEEDNKSQKSFAEREKQRGSNNGVDSKIGIG